MKPWIPVRGGSPVDVTWAAPVRAGRRRLTLSLALASLLASVACGAVEKKSDSKSHSFLRIPAKVVSAPKRFKDDAFLCAPAVPAAATLVDAAPTVYTGPVADLLTARCVSCHTAGATAPDLSTYALAKSGGPRSAIRIAAGTMPPNGALAAPEQQLFASWAVGGFAVGTATPAAEPVAAPAAVEAPAVDMCKKSTPTPVPVTPAPALAVSYEHDISALITASCVSCHKTGGTPPDLSDYAKAVEAGSVSWEQIDTGKMPPPPATPLDAAAKALFKAWMDDSYLETAH